MAKKSFFSLSLVCCLFHLCVDLRREFGFNSTSQKHSTILYLCTESFQAENKVPLSNDLNLSQFVEKMKLAANEQACQDGTVHYSKLTLNRSISKETRNLKQKWGNLLFWKKCVDIGLKNRESHDGLGATRDRKVQPICEMLS